MAQTIQADGSTGFPLSLSWVEWDSTEHSISYLLETDKLYRSYTVNGGEPSRSIVAKHINTDSLLTNCQFNAGILTLKITASVDGFRPTIATRIIEIMPRSVP